MPHRPALSRRVLMSASLATPFILSGARPALAHAPRPGSAAPPPQGLNRHALAGGRFYGAAIDNAVLRSDHAYMAQVPRECGIVTGESAFKWGEIHPQPAKYDFSRADRLVSFAARHAMQVRGHALLWHRQNPKWLEDALANAKPGEAERTLRTHIAAVCRHYRRKLTQWDVVNEVLWPADNKPMGLRDTLWYRALGPALLDIAFHACAEADPGALRFINDFGMDYSWPDNERKRQAMLALIAGMKARGVPVQGLGIQAHLEADAGHALDQTILAKFCADAAALGVQIAITELDIRDNRLPADLAVRDAAVAAHGRAFLDAVLASPAVLGVVSWGLSDRRTWLNDDLPRHDGLPQRALPLDTEMARKPLWSAMAASFDAAPHRA